MLRYRLLVWLLAPVLLLYTLVIALRERDLRYLRERLGLARLRVAPGAIWLHAASVGEVNAAAALIRRLGETYPARALVLTTGTPTGAAAARRHFGDRLAVHYLPIDWPWAVRRWVRRLRPACLLVLETELWPHLYRACARADVPIVIVNGRLSMRSIRSSRWWRIVQGKTLARVRTVLARSAADAETFMALGMDAGRVRTLGNVKFALSGETPSPISLGRPYVLAGSTREDEERLIVEQWRACRHGGRLLVIAPRHPQRLGEILQALAPFNARLAIRSRAEPIGNETEIYIADTLGELQGFIAGADLVVLGGSFVPVGGHNILEVARAGKTVIFGPHMKNFADEAELLTAHDAGIQLRGIEELAGCLTDLLADEARRIAIGRNGARLIATRAHVIDDYLAALAELCPALAAPAS